MADIIYVILILFLLIDAYGSIDTVYKYIHIHSYSIALLLLGCLFFIRIKYKIKLSSIFYKINKYFIFPGALLSGVLLLTAYRLTPPNFIYSLIPIRPGQIYFIGLTSGIVLLSQQKLVWYKENYVRIIFLGGILLSIALWIGNLFPFGQFIFVISKEDGFLEIVQNIVLLVSCFLSSSLSYYYFSRGKRISGFIYTALFLAIAFIFLEEISWGQRIFEIQTPNFFNEYNVQKETSIHNLKPFQPIIDKMYLILCFLGSFAWLIKKIISRANFSIKYFIPGWFTSSYFFIAFLFYTYNLINQEFNYLYESMELLTYMGITFYLLSSYLVMKKILIINY